MLAVDVEFLHGTIRAGSPDDLALTGQQDPGEWPPSPARLFAALVAADGTRDRCRVTDGSELSVLEHAGPPLIFADRREDVLVSAQVPRFVVADRAAKSSVQEYVGRTATAVRPAPRLSPKSPTVTFVWPQLEVDDNRLRGLRARAARVGYLGCADSPVRIRVQYSPGTSVPEDRGRLWEPHDQGGTLLPVPFPGLVAVLDRMYDDFAGGMVPRRAWYRVERQRYRSPDAAAVADMRKPPVTIWLRFERTASGRHVLAVTEALRAATLASYERHVGDVPQTLHAHGYSTTGYDHVSWLALPDVGHAHASGRIHGAAVMLPADTEPEVVDGVRGALRQVRELLLPGGVAIGIAPYQGQRRPWAVNPRRWTRPARTWASAFPVVHERWSKRSPDLGEITRWCAHAGLPEPVRARLSRPPLLQRGVSLMPHEAARKGQERRPYSHLEVTFAEQVRGPVALGRLRHFGVGLMAPVGDRAERDDGPQSPADEAVAGEAV